MTKLINRKWWAAILLAGVLIAPSGRAAGRVLRAGDLTVARGQTNLVSVVLEAAGDENVLNFSLCYETNLLTFVQAVRGADATNAAAALLVNTDETSLGRVGFTLTLPSAQTFAADSTNSVVEVFFAAALLATTTATSVTNCDLPVARAMLDTSAAPLAATYTDAVATITGCSFSLAASSVSAGDIGDTNTVGVTTETGCVWTVDNTNGWITIGSETNATNSGNVSYVVAANLVGLPRTGIVVIASQTFTVQQAAAPCAYALTPGSRSHTYAPETGLVAVTAVSGCAWSVSNGTPWITITGATSGTGDGSFGYQVATNDTGLSRSGVLEVNGQFFTVTQSGTPCAYVLTPTGRSHSFAPETGLVAVTAVSGCAWSVSNGTPWLTITTTTFGGETESGWQQVNFGTPVSIAANTVYVASYHCKNGHWSVNNDGFAASGVDNPPLHALANGVAGGNGVYAYGATSAFPQDSNSDNYWVDVAFQAGPSGPATIWADTTVPALADVGPDAALELGVKFRSDVAGTITGIRFYKASANTGPHVVNLWTSTGTLLARATNGSGNGSFGYQVATNDTGLARSGVLEVNGQLFTVTQSGTPCAYVLTPTGRSHTYAPETGLVAVTAVSGCAWSVSNGTPWITITGATSGTGDGSFGYQVATNDTGLARSGVLEVNGQLFTVTQNGTPCAYVLTPAGRSHSFAPETGLVAVTAVSGCAWSVSNGTPWITITGATSGTGDGSFGYQVATNDTGLARSGVLEVNGQLFTVTQSGTPCAYVLTPAGRSHTYAPETGLVAVTAVSGCAWSVSNGTPWITITGATSGTGDGSFGYQVATNDTGLARSGVLEVNGQLFTVTQNGTPCAYVLTPAGRSHSFAPETGLVAVTAVSGCAWSVSNGTPWITITGATSGTGDGSFGYQVATNDTGLARSGVLEVNGQLFTVTQSGTPCAYVLTPAGRSHTYAPETGLVAVTAVSGCAWSVSNGTPWITITGATSGTGDGSFGYQVATNDTGLSRSGVLEVNGQFFTVTQSGTPCAYVLTPTGRSHSFAPETGLVAVTAVSGCAWSVSNGTPWLTITTTTFGGETESGWQQVNFGTPVSIAANTVYVASYHCKNGHWSVNNDGFAASGVDNPPLHALANGVAGGNGVYAYGATSAFPQDSNSDNYWVDVAFQAGPSGPATIWADTTVPALADVGPDAALELGVKFRSDVAGTITGIRFYKASANTGPHVVNLWTSTGTLLARATNGSGNGSFGYRVATNDTGLARSGVFGVNGQFFTVTQSGTPCAYVLTPAGRSHSFAPETGLVAVTAVSGCAWSVSNGTPWITITGATSGTGDGSFGYQVATNDTGLARSGVLEVNGQLFTVTQNGTPCAYVLTPAGRSHSFAPETGLVAVTAVSGCAWSVSNGTPWITITGATSGTGDGSFGYQVATNDTGLARSGVLEVNGQLFTVTQSGTPCAYVLTPTGRSHSFAPETGLVAVTAVSGCAWSVSNGTPWLTITTTTFGGETESGWQQVNFGTPVSIAANTVYVASYHCKNGHWSVNNDGFAASGVDNPPLHALANGVAGGNGVYAYGATSAFPQDSNSDNYWVDVAFQAGPSGPATIWADTTVPALADVGPDAALELGVKFRSDVAGTITGIRFYKASANTGPHVVNLWTSTGTLLARATNGSGNGSFGYRVATNDTGLARSGVFGVNGQFFTVTQSGTPCAYVLTPAGRSHSFAPETGLVAVTAVSGCAWSVSNGTPWITITGATSGTGDGSFGYQVATNDTGLARSGVLEVNGQLFTVTQSGTPCAYVLTPAGRSLDHQTNGGTVTVTTPLGCLWTVDNTNPWVTITSDTNGSNSGSFTYLVASNGTALARSAAVRVADQVFSLQQSGAPCGYALSTALAPHPDAAVTAQVSVATLVGCNWTATTVESWISLLSGGSGSGPGTVSYALTANPTALARTGLVTIAGLTLTVSQAGAPCTFALSPPAWIHRPGAETGLVNVTTVPGCPWTAASTNSWITITSATNFTNSGRFTYAVTAQPAASDRTGVIVIGDQSYLVTQLGTGCTYRLSSTNRFHDPGAATGSLSVTTGVACGWSVINTNEWVTITGGAGGTGPGSVSYTLAANPNPGRRTGLLNIGGELFTLHQWGTACQFLLAPAARAHGAGAETGLVSLATAGSCAWTVDNPHPWITFPAGLSGTGSGEVAYLLSPNPAALPRTGVFTLGAGGHEQAFTVHQAAAACSFALTSAGRAHGALADTGEITLTTLVGCTWPAGSLSDWITLASGPGGSNSGTVAYALAANPAGLARTGYVAVAGQLFTVSQAGAACTFALAPASRAHGAGAEAGTITVNTRPGCPWTVSNTVSWITFLGGAGGPETGSASYALAANPAAVARTGVVQVAGQPFTITQAAAACAPTLAPASWVHGSGQETGLVHLTTLAGCAWTTVNTNPWLTLLSGPSGTGPGSVAYVVASNASASARSGVLTVAGLPCAVTQAGRPCAFALGATSRAHGAGAETGTVSVTTSNGCPWTVVNTNSWLTINSGGSGSGPGLVEYTVAAHSAAPGVFRRGTLLIAGLPCTVSQSGTNTMLRVLDADFVRGGATNHLYLVLDAQGFENAVSVSLCFDTNLLTFIRAAKGADAVSVDFGSTLNVNTNSIRNTGCVGFALALDSGVAFTPGPKTIIDVSFRAVAGTSFQTTPVSLGASPIANLVATVTADEFTPPLAGAVVTLLGQCTYALATNAVSFNAGGGAGTVSVLTPGGQGACPWRAGKTNDWITLTAGEAGAGSGSVNFTVSANPSALARTGVITVAGQAFTVSQAGVACAVALAPAGAAHGPDVAAGFVNVAAAPGCGWTAGTTDSWIVITSPTNGSGPGGVSYALAANLAMPARTGAVLVAGQTFAVSQAGATCVYAIAPAQRTHGASVEAGPISVTTPGGCPWTVSNPHPWITLTTGTNGAGGALVVYRVAANPGPGPRAGTFVVAGHDFTVNQAGAGCLYAIAPAGRGHSFNQENGQVTVSSSNGCQWSAFSSHEWITITAGAAGSGSSLVLYTVAANPVSTARTGLVSVAGQIFTVTQAASPCAYSIAPGERTHGPGPEEAPISIATFNSCAWTAVTTNPWITFITASNGTGSGSLSYRVGANPAALTRTGAVVIVDQVYLVRQTGAACTFTATPASQHFVFGAGTGQVSVATLLGCSWTIHSTSSWITVTGATNRTNSGTVNYSVLANPIAIARTSVVMLAGQPYTVSQAGTPCSYALSVTNLAVANTAVTGTVNVTSITGCDWLVVNTNSWIAIPAGATGSGSGTVTYTVEANPSSSGRTGVVTIAGRTLTLSQAGSSCTYALSPANQLQAHLAATGTVSVTTFLGCAWTTVNTNPWIQITAGASGTGSGSVTYTVPANPTITGRTGVVTIAGQLLTVRQTGAPCAFTLTPTHQAFPAVAGTGLVSVATLNGCSWTIGHTSSWITITGATNRTNSGTVAYTVAGNLSPVPRVGVVTLGGGSLVVTQAGFACTYALLPTSRVHGALAEQALISVTSSNGCQWAVLNTNESWITIKSGEVGTNNGTVRYTAQANPNPGARTGVLVIGGQPYTVTQSGTPCNYSLLPAGRIHGSGSETGLVSVFTVAECGWAVDNTNGWVTFRPDSPTNSAGNANVGYLLQANPSAMDRTAVFTIATETFAITQLGSPCAFTLTPPALAHGAGVETGTVMVATMAGCSWTASETNTWITILSGTSGTSTGQVVYALSVNFGPNERTGLLNIGDRTFLVTQAGLPCEYSLAPSNRVHGPGAEAGVVSVTTSNLCPWFVENTNTWITIGAVTSGTGNSNVLYAVAPHYSPDPRTGAFTIGTATCTITQAGIICSYALAPSSRGHGYAADTGLVSVTTSNLCRWSVQNTNTWITITSGTNGTGNLTVAYATLTNPGTNARAGVFNIGGQPFTLTQSGLPFLCAAPRTVECGEAWNFQPPAPVGTCLPTNYTLTLLGTVTNTGGACPGTFTATRTWEAQDSCGNRVVCAQSVTVADTTPPVLVCAAQRSVPCGAGWTFDAPTASDACAGTNVTVVVTGTVTNRSGFCGNTFSATRSWRGTDACGNQSTCAQTVTVVDTTPPVLACPPDKTVECGGLVKFDSPTGSDACGGSNVTITVLGTVTNGAGFCGGTFSATRTWEGLDSCGNRSTCAQTIRVVDTTAPVLLCSGNKIVECGLAWSFDVPAASDGCGSAPVTVRVTGTVTNRAGFCGGTFSATRTWEALDGCSNRSTCAQLVIVADTTAPALTCPPERTVEAGAAWAFAGPMAFDTCDGTNVSVQILGTVTNRSGFCGNTFSVTRTWEALDGCGNRSSPCAQTVRVLDTTAPVLTCAAGKMVMCGTAWSFDAPTVSDAGDGTNVAVTVVSTVTNGPCGHGTTIVRTWQAQDLCGNRATCAQTITTIQHVVIGGTVSYATNYPLSAPTDKRAAGVTMRLTGDTNASMTTAAGGGYSFVVEAEDSGQVTPAWPDSSPVAAGVTTVDISLIRRHILNIASLASPYQLLAADVNGSRSVTTVDISQMRRLILGVTNTLPAGLWRFVPADYVFPNVQNPWDAPTNRSYANLLLDVSGQDFLAIKLGDVNNSWTPPTAGLRAGFAPAAQAPAPAALAPEVILQVSRHTNQPGDSVVARVSASAFHQVTSAQGTLAWDPEVLRLVSPGGYRLAGLTAANFGTSMATNGWLTFSWDDPAAAGVSVADGTTLFTVNFEVISGADHGSPLALVDTGTQREVAVNFVPATLRTKDGHVIVNGVGPEVTLQVSTHTNQPADTVRSLVTASEFWQVTRAQGTLVWDPAVLRFTGTAGYGINGLTAGNFGTTLTTGGKLSFSWDDAAGSGATLAEGATLFGVDFEVIGGPGSGSTLALTDAAMAREVVVSFAPALLRTLDGHVTVTSHVAPRLTQPVYSSGIFSVPLPTESGRLYILEYTETLPGTNWTALPPVVGDGAPKILTDPTATSVQRFYRVRIQ